MKESNVQNVFVEKVGTIITSVKGLNTLFKNTELVGAKLQQGSLIITLTGDIGEVVDIKPMKDEINGQYVGLVIHDEALTQRFGLEARLTNETTKVSVADEVVTIRIKLDRVTQFAHVSNFNKVA